MEDAPPGLETADVISDSEASVPGDPGASESEASVSEAADVLISLLYAARSSPQSCKICFPLFPNFNLCTDRTVRTIA